MAETAGVWIGAILTLLVFSFLLGDTPLFRLAQAVFVGVAVGYALTVAVYLVLIPRMIAPLALSPSANWHLFFPLILGISLLFKLRTSWAPVGNLAVAFLFGVGGALAITGALSGTLVPQISATFLSLAPAQGVDTAVGNLLLVFGTIGAFLSFRFITAPRRTAARALDTVGRGWSYLGRWFVLVAFGAIFASAAVSRVSVLIGRVYYLMHDWLQVVP